MADMPPERVSAAGLSRFQAWAPSWTASQGRRAAGLGQVEVADRVDRHAVEDRGGGDIDALGHLGCR